MIHRRRPGGSPVVSQAALGDVEAFRLIGIRPERAPEGCAGRDWFVYEIVQGPNTITGHRQGDAAAVAAEVEKIVLGLNERLMRTAAKSGPKPKSAAAASATSPPPRADDEGDDHE